MPKERNVALESNTWVASDAATSLCALERILSNHSPEWGRLESDARPRFFLQLRVRLLGGPLKPWPWL
ncbi:MAG: hypothetical protein ACI841_003735 [Planctomycetota bacterium]|jgi:hypothetical protein